MSRSVEDLATLIRDRAGAAPVRLGLILGSGLGHLAGAVQGVAIPYADLPGFPHVSVSGHNPNLVIGDLEGVRVAVFGAREHYYENGNAGAMLLSDHINYSGMNPLIGEPTDARFVPMTAAHDPTLRASLRAAAEAEGVALPEGVYCWYSGPSFETPAEIRMLKLLGGDAVGMSTVPEVILARFLGLRVAAVSTITNMAAGLSDEQISHEHTKAMAPLGAAKLERVLRHFLQGLARA
jgi:purine-nucleoside phosphorylase